MQYLQQLKHMVKHQSFVYCSPKQHHFITYFLLALWDGDDRAHEGFSVPWAKQTPTYGCHNRCCQELGQSAVKPPGRWSLTAELEEGWARPRHRDSAWTLREWKVLENRSAWNCAQLNLLKENKSVKLLYLPNFSQNKNTTTLDQNQCNLLLHSPWPSWKAKRWKLMWKIWQCGDIFNLDFF